jgi:alpha/beta superfamily hydrolase
VKWLTAAVERGREYLVVHLSNMLNLNCTLSGFSFGNVVVLKLKNVRVDIFSSVVFFPSLRIVYLNKVYFLEPMDLLKVLNGCPILEVF